MATGNQSLRRRAAWAVLAPVIEEDELIEALWLQHDGMRGESISDIIGFIDAVAARNLLDAVTRKRLYANYFDALRQAEETLPIDPWPMMLLARPAAAGPAQLPQGRSSAAQAPSPAQTASVPATSAPANNPVAQAVGPAPPITASSLNASIPPAPEPSATSPHQAVFAALASTLVGGVRQFYAADMPQLLEDCRARIERQRLPDALRQGVSDALASTQMSAWYLDASLEHLAAIVHELYVGLCEAIGPVAADQMLVYAVREAEQRPEARQVPPSRFL